MKAPAEASSMIVPFPFDAGGSRAAGQALAEGRVMAYPTETSYALGGNALDTELVERIFALKGRSEAKALLLLIEGQAQARELTVEIGPAVEALMNACWPGPLTLVLRAGPKLPAHLRNERGTVALRHSPHPAVAELLRIAGAPLIGTSANRSGGPAALEAGKVAAIFAGAVELIVDAGEAPGGAPSTLLDVTARPFRVLRAGAVSLETLRGVLADDFPDAFFDAMPQ